MTCLKDKINYIIQLIDSLKKKGIKDEFELEMMILNNYPELYEEYPAIIKRLCREEVQDNAVLFQMIQYLEDIEKGKTTMESVEKKLGEELAEKYVYPLVKSNINADANK
jgi:hypothetical protein